jgi:hypothetical protein
MLLICYIFITRIMWMKCIMNCDEQCEYRLFQCVSLQTYIQTQLYLSTWLVFCPILDYILIFMHVECWRTLLDWKFSGLKVDFLAERLRKAWTNISISSHSNDLTAAHCDALWRVASNKPCSIIITPAAYVKTRVGMRTESDTGQLLCHGDSPMVHLIFLVFVGGLFSCFGL